MAEPTPPLPTTSARAPRRLEALALEAAHEPFAVELLAGEPAVGQRA